MHQLQSFIENLKESRRLETFDEAATKQAVILRLLSLLGWDCYDIDEVTPEYSVSSQRIDYALRLHHSNKVFIEVKKIGEELERHQEQLLNYSFQEGVKLAILTNGVRWWFYLPLNEGSWEQRKFYTIDILEQESADICKKFQDFLSRQNIAGGDAIKYAERIHYNQQKRQFARKSLPKAWDKLIEEPDELLVELLGETAERLSGYKIDLEVVAQFIQRHQAQLTVGKELTYRRTPSTSPRRQSEQEGRGIDQDYTGQNVRGFSFQNRRYDVSSWRDLLVRVCEIISQRNPSEFNRVLQLTGRKRPYFSRNPDELRNPAPIAKSGIFTETNLSANGKVRRACQVLSLFDYDTNDLSIFAS